MHKTIGQINERIRDGSARVVTAEEMPALVAELGEEGALREIDVVTTGTFGAMCIYGATTKRDLTSMGNLLFMALFGLILASVVNIFWHSSGLYWVVTYAGILIFVGLTAYDAQKIKRMHAAGMEGTEEDRKAAVLGALALYLDFINLFLLLLRLFGRRK